MSDADREHLLGYLFGALDSHEHQRVEESIQRNPRLREQLDRLRAHVAPLELDREHHEPPLGLAKRTCAWVSSQIDPALCQAASAQMRDQAGARSVALRSLHERRESPRSGGWSLPDLLVTAGIVLVASMLFFPAIAHSRFRSQLLACQHNLGRLGMALQQFAQDHSGFFPQESERGLRAFAGIYSVDLLYGGYVNDQSMFVCPAAPPQSDRPRLFIPTPEQLELATDEERRKLQRHAGGDLAYCLGYLERGKYTGPRDYRRASFALLSDIPCRQTPGMRSPNHCRRGQNVLFESGHVLYLVGGNQESLRDNLYVNMKEVIGAGLTSNDCVLAESWYSPRVGEVELQIAP